MNIQTFKRIAPVLFRNKVVPFLWGSQGIGKTETLKQIAAESGYAFVHLHMANLEVGDLVGLLMKRDDGTVYHARPEWLPVAGSGHAEKGIIFLDELNRMHPDVMQAMFSFITSGLIHRHQLAEGWVIAAAGNYGDNGNFNVTDTSDAAWMSRFCHIDFKPTIEEFSLHARKRGAVALADFIREQPQMLEKNADQKFNFQTITPDRRAWLNYLTPLEYETMLDEDRFEIYQGLVGPSAAAAYMTHKKTEEKSLNLERMLVDYSSQKNKVLAACKGSKTRLDYLNKPVAELLTALSDNSEFLVPAARVDNLKLFLLDVPLELSQRVFKDLEKLDFEGKKQLLNDLTFCKKIAAKVG